MSDDVLAALEALKARHTTPEKDPGKQWPYRLVHFDDLRPGTKSRFLVDGVIPRSGIVAVWGAPKSGKSFWTFDLVMHVALGWFYRGRYVEQGPVAYLAFEGADGFHDRAEAFRKTHEITTRPWFYLLASNAKLVRDYRALIESIDGQMDAPPTCVVLDTLNRSIDGSESKDQDMGAYLAAAEAICEAFDCVVIIVHHSGIAADRPRGHTSLTGTATAQISVKRDPVRNIVVEVECMKDGPEGSTFTSSLQVIEVGKLDDGRPVTSCAILPIVEGTPNASNDSSIRMTANQRRFFEILTEAILDAPETHRTTINIPGGRTAISREWLKTCCKSKGWLEPDASENNQRAKVSNMLNALAGKHLVGLLNLYVWVAK